MHSKGSDQKGSARVAPHEAILERPAARALPLVSDHDVAMALVRQYVEAERIRSRRILVWVSTIFLLIIVFVLVVFTAVGITVLTRSQKATDLVEEVRARTAAYAAEVVGVTARLTGIEDGTNRMQAVIEDAELQRTRESTLLKSDLKRFSRWVDSQNANDSQAIARLEDRLKQMAQEAALRERELQTMREEYASLRSTLTAPGRATEVAAAPVYATEMNERPASTDGTAETAAPEGTTTGSPPGTASEVNVVAFSNGDRYEGQFKDGLFDGWGVYYFANGDRYEGEFHHDIKEGRGTLTFADGDRYEGQFRDDMINGKGSLLYRNGNRYSGDFRNGLRHGNGVLSFHNGDVYRGDFQDDARSGRGTYLFADGAKYIGEFVDGRRHGNGRYIYPGGEEYVGEFTDGRKNGVGECLYPNGDRVRGLWENDKFKKVLE